MYLFSNQSKQILFSKDDNVGGSNNTMYVQLYVQNGKLSFEVSCIDNYSISDTATDSTADFPQASWEYWAISVKMNNDAINSTIRFIKGVTNTELDHTPNNGTHFIDTSTGQTFIGHSRDADKNAQNHMHGLIYNFHIDRGFYNLGDAELHYGNSG